MSEALELRVLSGLHRDARCQVADGAVLGADPACDIVLADDGIPRAARVRIGEGGWDLALDDAAPNPQPGTPFNRPVPLARSGSPWPVAATPGPTRPMPPTTRWRAWRPNRQRRPM
ncbi:hypothetical protein WJ972_28700 [Achromobacter insuavis]